MKTLDNTYVTEKDNRIHCLKVLKYLEIEILSSSLILFVKLNSLATI